MLPDPLSAITTSSPTKFGSPDTVPPSSTHHNLHTASSFQDYSLAPMVSVQGEELADEPWANVWAARVKRWEGSRMAIWSWSDREG